MKDDTSSTDGKRQPDVAVWKDIVAQYQKSSTWRALWQMVDTLVPYGLLWFLIYHSLAVSWWITVPLTTV